MGHPLTIDFREVALMLTHIRWSQGVLDSGNRDLLKHVFQFKHPEGNDDFQATPDPKSTLVYDEDSAFYYMADQKHHFGPNAYLPTPPPEPLFTHEGEKIYGHFADPLNADIRDVKWAMDMLHKAEIEEFQISDTDHPLHRRYRYSANNVVSYMTQPMLCREVYDWMNDHHRHYEFGSYVHWVRSGALLDPATGKIKGGYGGLFAAFMNGLRLECTKRKIASSVELSNNPHILKFDGTDMKNMVTELFIYLRDKARETLRNTLSPSKTTLPPGSRLSAFRPSVIRYRKANEESGVLEPKDYEPSNDDRESLGLSPEGVLWQHNSVTLAPNYEFSKEDLQPGGYDSQLAALLVPPTESFNLKPTKTTDPRRRPATIAVPPIPLPPVANTIPAAEASRRSSSEEPRPTAPEAEDTFSAGLQIDLREPPSTPASPTGWMAPTGQFSPSALEQEAEMSTPNPSRGRPLSPKVAYSGRSDKSRSTWVAPPADHTPAGRPAAPIGATTETDLMQIDVPEAQVDPVAPEPDESAAPPEKTGPKTRSASGVRDAPLAPKSKTPTTRQKPGAASRAPSTSAKSVGSGSQTRSLRAPSREPAIVAESAATMDEGNVSDYLSWAARQKASRPEMEPTASSSGASVVARHVPKKKRGASPDARGDEPKKRGSVSR
ncbi:hypothetical protein RhiJN_19965 [Ceratobasidium sp. AG-Ba]|nr:hypothetical protein RhiJN_19965 [Ceratobasidium sp. AG-Ba]